MGLAGGGATAQPTQVVSVAASRYAQHRPASHPWGCRAACCDNWRAWGRLTPARRPRAACTSPGVSPASSGGAIRQFKLSGCNISSAIANAGSAHLLLQSQSPCVPWASTPPSGTSSQLLGAVMHCLGRFRHPSRHCQQSMPATQTGRVGVGRLTLAGTAGVPISAFEHAFLVKHEVRRHLRFSSGQCAPQAHAKACGTAHGDSLSMSCLCQQLRAPHRLPAPPATAHPPQCSLLQLLTVTASCACCRPTWLCRTSRDSRHLARRSEQPAHAHGCPAARRRPPGGGPPGLRLPCCCCPWQVGCAACVHLSTARPDSTCGGRSVGSMHCRCWAGVSAALAVRRQKGLPQSGPSLAFSFSRSICRGFRLPHLRFFHPSFHTMPC